MQIAPTRHRRRRSVSRSRSDRAGLYGLGCAKSTRLPHCRRSGTPRSAASFPGRSQPVDRPPPRRPPMADPCCRFCRGTGAAVGCVCGGNAMAEHEETGTAGCRQTLRRYLPLGLLLAAMAAVYAAGGHRHISFAALAEHREALLAFVAAHRVAALGLYMLVYVAAIALSLPGGALLTIAGGFLFGWLVAGAAVVVAATVGATIVFLVARTSLGETLSRRAGPALNRLAVGFRQDALAYLLFLRLVPVFPFWLVNLAPALLG